MNGMKCSELHVDTSEPLDDAEYPFAPGWRICWEVGDELFSYCVNSDRSFASEREATLVLRAFNEAGITADTLMSLPEFQHPDWQRIDRIAAEALPW